MKSTILFVFLTCTLLQNSFCSDPAQVDERLSSLENNVQDLATEVRTLVEKLEKIETNDPIAPIIEPTTLEIKTPDLTDDLDPSRLNGTIEERVTLLELQVGDLTGDLEAVEDEVTLITSGQLIQDQRIIELEIDADGFEDSIEDLIATDVSVNLELDSVDATLVNLEDRMQAHEVAGAVAFQAEIGEYSSIPEDSVVLFSIVDLNLGDGFNMATGEFTVPPGGAGLYYFRFGYISDWGEFSSLYIRVNGGYICRAYQDMNSSGANDRENSSCAAVVTLVEGDLVDVYYDEGTDDTPVFSSTVRDNTFTGFRIAPE